MKTNMLKRLLLLEQSGELTPKQRRQLDEELQNNEFAPARQAELRTLADAIPPAEIQASPDAAARIAARLAENPAPARRNLFRPVWKPALATAAALALLFGVRSYLRPDTAPVETAQFELTDDEEAWVTVYDEDFAELDSLLAEAEAATTYEFTEL